MSMTIEQLATGIEQIYDTDAGTTDTNLAQKRQQQSEQLAQLIGAFVIGRTTTGTDGQGIPIQTIIQ